MLELSSGNVLDDLFRGIADLVLVASLSPAAGAMTADMRTKIPIKLNADENSDEVKAANKCLSH